MILHLSPCLSFFLLHLSPLVSSLVSAYSGLMQAGMFYSYLISGRLVAAAVVAIIVALLWAALSFSGPEPWELPGPDWHAARVVVVIELLKYVNY